MKNKSLKTEVKAWEDCYGKRLSELEYKEICTNLNGFLSILQRWRKENE